jgi:hypothetical protein
VEARKAARHEVGGGRKRSPNVRKGGGELLVSRLPEKKRFFRSDFSVTGQPSLVDAHD